MRACYKLKIIGCLLGLVLFQGCSEQPAPTQKPLPKQWTAKSAASAASPALKPDIDALILEVAADSEQTAAIRQSSDALNALAVVPVNDAVELEFAVGDVLAGAACLKAKFSGEKLRRVTNEVPVRALATNAARLRAESALAAFNNNSDMGPLDLLKPAGSGCLDVESVPQVVVENDADEVYLDEAGNATAAPEVLASLKAN